MHRSVTKLWDEVLVVAILIEVWDKPLDALASLVELWDTPIGVIATTNGCVGTHLMSMLIFFAASRKVFSAS